LWYKRVFEDAFGDEINAFLSDVFKNYFAAVADSQVVSRAGAVQAFADAI
jgi:hypothetical protein